MIKRITNLSKKWLLLLSTSLACSCGNKEDSLSMLSEHSISSNKSVKYQVRSFKIPSFDGTPLSSLLFEPKASEFPGPRPTVIFANSWICDEYEYVAQGHQLAEKGYVVLSYATRGFGRSGGIINVASPDDTRDVSTIIDWLIKHTQAAEDKIAMLGISYGGGIALLALGQEERLKTAIAMSSWADLEMALYADSTIREVWLNLLLGSGKIMGRLSPELPEIAKKLRERKDIEEISEWARIRSPITYIDAINKRKAPVFVLNSYQDNLFPPRQMREFFEKLEGPKHFFMDPGIHTSSHAPGAFGFPSKSWEDIHEWLETYLLNTSEKFLTKAPLGFQSPQGREYFEQFPVLDASLEELALTPVNQIRQTADTHEVISFSSKFDSGANTGVPVLSDTFGAHAKIPTIQWIPAINKKFGAVYQTEKLKTDLELRGSAQIKFWLIPQDQHQHLVAYLYDVNQLGFGKLITHGVITNYEQSSEIRQIKVDLNVIAYDIPRNHSLSLVIDSWDPYYFSPNKAEVVKLEHYKDHITELALPIADKKQIEF